MAALEFDLINRYFASIAPLRACAGSPRVLLGIGDDAAVIDWPDGTRPVGLCNTGFCSHDLTSVELNRLLQQTLCDLYLDSLSRRLQPEWLLLNYSLTDPHSKNTQAIANTLATLLDYYNVQLIGGDTTSGIDYIGLSLMGRSTVNYTTTVANNDLIYVSGTLGQFGLSLLQQQNEIKLIKAHREMIEARYAAPLAQCRMSAALMTLCNGVIPLRHGLLQDLTATLEQYDLGADCYLDQLPIHPELTDYLSNVGGQSFLAQTAEPLQCAVIVPETQQASFESLCEAEGLLASWIGTVSAQAGVRLN